ncbi:hypothetical protein ACYX7E_03845 [Luteimonas sp. RIT-PG2_3]
MFENLMFENLMFENLIREGLVAMGLEGRVGHRADAMPRAVGSVLR